MGRSVLAMLITLAAAGAWSQGVHRGVPRLTLASGIAQTLSRECGACHSPQLSFWIRHAHSHYLVDPDSDPRYVYARWQDDAPGYAAHVQGRFERQEVDLAYGVLQIQIYFRRTPDGHVLFPAQWNLREERWEALPPELREVQTSGATWERQCAGCHTTGFDPEDGTFEEANTGCGACHGDGLEHLESGGREPILRPSTLEPRRRSAVCGACHSRGRSRSLDRPYPVGFRPGGLLKDVFTLEEPRPGETTEAFWPDGTERLPFMEYLGFLQSGHYRVGLSCTTCHLPHGSEHPRSIRRKSADLCRGCHDAREPGGRTHRAHPQKAATCVDCHMSLSNPRPDRAHFRTHTFRFLNPVRALETPGKPSSCTVSCHSGKDDRWAADAMETWSAGE